jgi:hypothetical protein
MMSTFFCGCTIYVVTGCREYLLPSPLFVCVHILTFQALGKAAPPKASFGILFVLSFLRPAGDVGEILLPRREFRRWDAAPG